MPQTVIDGRGGRKEKRRGKFESDSGRLLEGRRREMSSTLRRRSLSREQNMQLERQYTVKWSLLELMSTLSVRTLKCSLTRACSSSSNTSHRIILSPVFSSPVAGREAHLGGRRTKGSKQGFGSDRVTSRLLKLDHDRQPVGCSGAPSRGFRHG